MIILGDVFKKNMEIFKGVYHEGGGGVLDDSWSVGRAEAFKQQQGGESFEETSRESVRGEAPARKQIAGERSKRERERTHH